jgi:hypothetical protein
MTYNRLFKFIIEDLEVFEYTGDEEYIEKVKNSLNRLIERITT